METWKEGRSKEGVEGKECKDGRVEVRKAEERKGKNKTGKDKKKKPNKLGGGKKSNKKGKRTWMDRRRMDK